MTDNETIKLVKSDEVASITFARPKHNVFNIDMMRELCAALEDVSRDDSLKCVVFYGEGASWCAGVDVGDHKPEMAPDMIATFNRSLTLISDLEIPSIAAVHGNCLGGGMEYAIACDVVIASKKAKFGQPEVKLGFLPPYAAIRLPQLIGPAKAIEVCTSGKIYSADEAQLMGFVSQSVASDEFTETVVRLIHEIQASSPLILRLNKRAVNQHMGLSPKDALEGVSDLFLNTLMKTEDTLEGIASFYEKRRPDWKNR